MTLTTPTTTSGRRSDGTRIRLAVCQALAPSTLAASTSSYGTAVRPAVMVMTPKPVNAQNAGTIRARLVRRMSAKPRWSTPGLDSQEPGCSSSGPRRQSAPRMPSRSRTALRTPISGSAL